MMATPPIYVKRSLHAHAQELATLITALVARLDGGKDVSPVADLLDEIEVIAHSALRLADHYPNY